MKRALVTGGAGFLGSHLCRRLLADGFDVTALDNLYTGSRRNIEDLVSNPSFRLIEGDVIDYTTDEMCIEITGDPSKIDAFIKLMLPFGIIEMCRTGIVALDRGNTTLLGKNN